MGAIMIGHGSGAGGDAARDGGTRPPRPPGATRGTGAAGSARTRRSGYVRTNDTVRPRSGGHGILAACLRGKRAIAGGFVVTSSPFLRVAVSESLPSGEVRDSASGWFAQVANLDTRAHVASA